MIIGRNDISPVELLEKASLSVLVARQHIDCSTSAHGSGDMQSSAAHSLLKRLCSEISEKVRIVHRSLD